VLLDSNVPLGAERPKLSFSALCLAAGNVSFTPHQNPSFREVFEKSYMIGRLAGLPVNPAQLLRLMRKRQTVEDRLPRRRPYLSAQFGRPE